MVYEPTLKVVWNMDEAVLKSIHYLKVRFVFQMQNWDLDGAYWTIRNIRMEIDSKLKDKEQENVGTKLKEMEDQRKKYLKDKKNKKGEFYLTLENYYILLNRYMKQHGLYFRENEDPRYAVLQR